MASCDNGGRNEVDVANAVVDLGFHSDARPFRCAARIYAPGVANQRKSARAAVAGEKWIITELSRDG